MLKYTLKNMLFFLKKTKNFTVLFIYNYFHIFLIKVHL